jgi:hypothetical protein
MAEEALVRFYRLLEEYDTLIELTVEPEKQGQYFYHRAVIQQNIAWLEQGLEALPLPEEVLAQIRNFKSISDWFVNQSEVQANRDVIQAPNQSGIINSGTMRDVSIHHHYRPERQSTYLTPPPAPDKFGGRDDELLDLK